MRKIHESDIQATPTKINYLFIVLSLAFALFSLAGDFLLIGSFFLGQNSKYDNYYFLIPPICSFLGVMLGYLAKEVAQYNLVISKQGCLAELSIYLNFVIFVAFLLSVCGISIVAFFID